MKRLCFGLAFYLAFSCTAHIVVAQPHSNSVDSLKILLKQSKPDTNRANLLLELARSYVLKPGELATDLDTALILVRQGYSISRNFRFIKGEGNAYLIGAQAYREKGDIPQARRFGQTAINRFSKNRNIAELAATHMEMGNTYGIEVDTDILEKVRHYQTALPLFRQVGSREREAITLKELGDFYTLLQKHPEALRYLTQALSVYKSINYPDLQGLYILLGATSANIGDYKSGLNYCLLALKTAELRKDTSLQVCTIYNRTGLVYHQLKEFEKASESFQKSLAIAQRYNDISSIWFVGLNLAHSYTLTKKYDQSLSLLKKLTKEYPSSDLFTRFRIASYFVSNYRQLHQYKMAQDYANQLQILILEKKNHNGYELAFLYPSPILFYIETEQFKQALPLLIDFTAWSNQRGTIDAKSLSHLYWFKFDSARSNYRSAIDHYQQYKTLGDSLINESKNKEIAKMQVEYETEQKEQQIQINKKDIQLLTSKSQSQLTTQKFTIAVAIMIALLLGLTYNRYRLKRRSNQQLEARQQLINQKNQTLQLVLSEKEQLLEEREWMLKEIHHRVKNNLQVISSMLNAQFDFLEDPTALAAIRESQNRVQVMALIHQRLYQSDNLGQIDVQQYIHEIVDYLIESFDREHSVRASCEITPLYLDVSLATPLGLIINEAVTNSLKYAFPNNRSGNISIKLVALADQTLQLMLSDDGVGLPTDFDVERTQTLGMTMIRGLSKQIRGTLTIIQNNGVEIRLRFTIIDKKAQF